MANMRVYMWDKMKDWLLHGAIESDEEMAADLAGPGYHINRSNLLGLESEADMQKRGQASTDDGDALALTFASGRVIVVKALLALKLKTRVVIRNLCSLTRKPCCDTNSVFHGLAAAVDYGVRGNPEALASRASTPEEEQIHHDSAF